MGVTRDVVLINSMASELA